MTAQEINNYFDLLYNNSTNYEGAGFSAKEKSLLLTYAQEQVLEKYYPISEANEEYKRFLLPLKKHYTTATVYPSLNYPNGYKFTIFNSVNPIVYVLGEYATQKFNENSKCPAPNTIRRVPKIKSITTDYYAANLDNPFKKPYSELAWRIKEDENTSTIIGDDTYSITSYSIIYYTKASPIIVPFNYTSSHGTIDGQNFASYQGGLVSSILDLHTEIVQEAVRIATAATKDQLGYQIQNIEKQLQ